MLKSILCYSVDINFDILIIEPSDSLALNIQRIGRNNRYNQNIDYNNLYIIKNATSVRFINEYKANLIAYTYFSKDISYIDVVDMRKNIKIEEIPSVKEILIFWSELTKNNIAVSLRPVPITFELDVNITINDKIIPTTKLFKQNNLEIQYARYPYSSNKALTKDIVWFGKNYQIINKLENGRFKIKELITEPFKECECENGLIEWYRGDGCEYCNNI